MAVKRIDFYKNENGKFEFKIVKGWFRIIEEEDGTIKLRSSNWDVLFTGDKIKFIGKSLSRGAGDDSLCREFNKELIEGSLFFYTSQTNWYWTWRDKEVQDIMDKYEINKIIPVEPNSPIELEQISSLKVFYNHKKYTDSEVDDSNLQGSKSFKVFYSDNTKIKSIEPDVLINHPSFKKNEYMVMSQVSIAVDRFIIVKNREAHRTLYISKNCSMKELEKELSKTEIVYSQVKPIITDKFIRKVGILREK